MIVKAYADDGRWDLWEGERMSFLGQGNAISVDDVEHRYSDDIRFPDGWEYFHLYRIGTPLCDPVTVEDPDPQAFRLVRWVKWFDPREGEWHLLVSDGPVFICNDRGDTVEALR